ncbi:hypothetical protein L2E82_24653 [Cichorium intybus]|uniref:Uncharacterized protein n=1 Tax=Cichorium intybus TaxID=13427 RepID=A0ACB9E0W7_CICIN|nr:hypothetical protein L2E82_24653 [Cichorium intybus]
MQALFVYDSMEDEDACKLVDGYFRINGDAPKVSILIINNYVSKPCHAFIFMHVIAFTDNKDSAHSRKFLMEGELTLNNIKSFGENFLVDNLKPFYKSDPIPEMNDGHVKIVVGNNFDEIVLHFFYFFQCDGFSTLLFFPAGNKSVDPITLYTNRTVKAFYKFLKQHAAIPFKLQKLESTQKPKPESTQESSNQDLKDEL